MNYDDNDYDYNEYYNDYYNENQSIDNNEQTQDLEHKSSIQNLILSKSAFSYRSIDDKEILLFRQEIIKEVKTFLEMPDCDVILALIYFKWNSNWLTNTWFDDPTKFSEEAGIRLSAKNASKLKNQGVIPNNQECLVCFTEKNDLENPENYFSLSCGHYFCSDCWYEYLTEKLNDYLSAITTTCPQIGCNCIITQKIFTDILKQKSPEIFILYIKSCTKNFTDYNTFIKACPSPGCETFIYCDQFGNKQVECPKCNFNFCFKCLKDGHKPCTCDMIDAWELKNKSESENIKWILVNTRKCPSCQKFIEKNQGCNFMMCSKSGGCGAFFCWTCMKILSSDHGGHECNVYKPKEESELNVEDMKNALATYSHHFERYNNHKKSMEYAVKTRDEINELISTLNRMKDIPFEELSFFKNAIKTTILARRLLFNSYIFVFYMKKNSNMRHLFEFHQSMLENKVETLHGLLENRRISSLLLIDDLHNFNKEFVKLRCDIIDLYTSTDNFIHNLISNIENSMIQDIDYDLIKEG